MQWPSNLATQTIGKISVLLNPTLNLQLHKVCPLSPLSVEKPEWAGIHSPEKTPDKSTEEGDSALSTNKEQDNSAILFQWLL